MATVIPTKLSTIVLALVARLVRSLSISASQVLVDAREDGDLEDLPTTAPQYLRVRVGQETPLKSESVDGIGRVEPRTQATIQVWLHTRLALDRPNEDLLALTKAHIGHLDGRHGLWDALLCFQPVDRDENWLVTEPIKPKPATRPRRSRKQKEWCVSGLEFSVTYAPDLDQTYQ